MRGICCELKRRSVLEIISGKLEYDTLFSLRVHLTSHQEDV